jgi:hypothetical protein
MKQTAVEWYAQHEIELTLEFLAKKISKLDYGLRRLNLLNQAQEMFKDQIMDAFYEGMNCQNFDPNKGRAEIYYNETFKN